MSVYYQPQLPLLGVRPADWIPTEEHRLKVFIDPDAALQALAADWTGTGPQCTCQHGATGRCPNPIFNGHIVWEFRHGQLCATHAALMHFLRGRCSECITR